MVCKRNHVKIFIGIEHIKELFYVRRYTKALEIRICTGKALI